jgi:hypothetical protein
LHPEFDLLILGTEDLGVGAVFLPKIIFFLSALSVMMVPTIVICL